MVVAIFDLIMLHIPETLIFKADLYKFRSLQDRVKYSSWVHTIFFLLRFTDEIVSKCVFSQLWLRSWCINAIEIHNMIKGRISTTNVNHAGNPDTLDTLDGLDCVSNQSNMKKEKSGADNWRSLSMTIWIHTFANVRSWFSKNWSKHGWSAAIWIQRPETPPTSEHPKTRYFEKHKTSTVRNKENSKQGEHEIKEPGIPETKKSQKRKRGNHNEKTPKKNELYVNRLQKQMRATFSHFSKLVALNGVRRFLLGNFEVNIGRTIQAEKIKHKFGSRNFKICLWRFVFSWRDSVIKTSTPQCLGKLRIIVIKMML